MEKNTRQQGDGLKLLRSLDDGCAAVVFFDPQYRPAVRSHNKVVEDRWDKRRDALPQQSDEVIQQFGKEIGRVLRPQGHLFLWIDKYHLLIGSQLRWTADAGLDQVDMLTWYKANVGIAMGYRIRSISEHLVVFQKPPRRAKGVWKDRNIHSVESDRCERRIHTHRKPIKLQTRLIEAVSERGDLVVDPCAGSFSVLEACQACGRDFIGCDLTYEGSPLLAVRG